MGGAAVFTFYLRYLLDDDLHTGDFDAFECAFSDASISDGPVPSKMPVEEIISKKTRNMGRASGFFVFIPRAAQYHINHAGIPQFLCSPLTHDQANSYGMYMCAELCHSSKTGLLRYIFISARGTEEYTKTLLILQTRREAQADFRSDVKVSLPSENPTGHRKSIYGDVMRYTFQNAHE